MNSVIPLNALSESVTAGRLDDDPPQPWQPPGNLTTAEHLLILIVRRWVENFKRKRGIDAAMDNAFIAANLIQAASAFDKLMSVIAISSEIQLDIRCLKCSSVGDGEKLILQTTRLFQKTWPKAADQNLTRWLPPAAARVVSENLAKVAAEMKQQNLILPLRVGLMPTVH